MATPAAGTHKDPAPIELPGIPKEFGQDNGEFYRHYDALAEELDDNMVKSLKEQLEGLLLFAGLFAGVNTTFLALTLPLLSADPVDDTNALLRENNAILLQLASNRNDSLPVASPLPSESFSVSGRILTVNVLFSISLTLALMSSLFAVLGRQWLINYRNHTGGRADYQRMERINRYLGARRWALEWLLGDLLHTVLQIGLILFGISLTIYLSTLHSTLANIVGAFLGTGMGLLVGIELFRSWDPYCPFRTPLSRMITVPLQLIIPMALQWMINIALQLIILVVTAAVALVVPVAWYPVGAALILLVITVLGPFICLAFAVEFITGRSYLPSKRAVEEFLFHQLRRLIRLIRLILLMNPRFAVNLFLRARQFTQPRKKMELALPTLQAEAVARVISYSDDRAAFMHATSNLLSIEDGQVLRSLASNDQFCRSLSHLCRTPYTETLHSQDPDQTELAIAMTWRYRAAMARIAFLATRSDINDPFTGTSIRRSFSIGEEHGLAIPSDFIKASPPTLINDCLGYVALLAARDVGSRPILGRAVTTAFEGLIDSSWERISALVTCMNVTCTTNVWGDFAVAEAFIGDPSEVLRNLELVLRRCMDPGCGAHNPFYEYLVDIFKFIRKAAIDSSGQSTLEIDLIAELLRLSEVFLRTEECPAEFSPVARGLRRDLLSALRSKCEGNTIADDDNRYLLGRVAYSLSSLFCVRLTISSNDDDLELAYLPRPILQRLDELPLGYWYKLQLRRNFQNFTSTVNRVAKLIKSRDRDPEQRWCHWREE